MGRLSCEWQCHGLMESKHLSNWKKNYDLNWNIGSHTRRPCAILYVMHRVWGYWPCSHCCLYDNIVSRHHRSHTAYAFSDVTFKIYFIRVAKNSTKWKKKMNWTTLRYFRPRSGAECKKKNENKLTSSNRLNILVKNKLCILYIVLKYCSHCSHTRWLKI